MDAVLIDSIFDYSFGFLLGFSLILAIGAQNAFVLINTWENIAKSPKQSFG